MVGTASSESDFRVFCFQIQRIKKRHKFTWHERFLVLKEASRLYAASLVRDIGPDLRPNDYKKDDGTEGKSNGDKSRCTETELSTLEDIGTFFTLCCLKRFWETF